MKMRKSVLLALFLIASLMYACGNSESGNVERDESVGDASDSAKPEVEQPGGAEKTDDANANLDAPTSDELSSSGTDSDGQVSGEELLPEGEKPLDESESSGNGNQNTNVDPGEDAGSNETGAGDVSLSEQGGGELDCEVKAPESLQADGLDNLHRISCDLYRSAQPTEVGVQSAKALGIRSILSLQVSLTDDEAVASQAAGIEYVNIPLVPWLVTQDNIINCLKFIASAPKPVLVHCYHGSDRTGLIVAMYRIVFQNWTKEAAKAEMTSEEFGFHETFENLLQTIDEVDVEVIRAAVLGDTAE